MKTRIFCSALIACAALQAGAVSARSNYIPRTERGQLVANIVQRWSGEAARQMSMSPAAWAKAMGGAFAHASIEQLRSAVSTSRFEDMLIALQPESMEAAALGAGSQLHHIVPCGPYGDQLSAGETVSLGGPDMLAFCGIPSTATGLVLHVTAMQPQANGFFSVFPTGNPTPLTGLLQYNTSMNSDHLVLLSGTDFQLFTQAATEVDVDILGYFAPAAVTQSCVSSAKSIVTVTDGSQGMFVNAPACPGGSNRVSVRCLVNNKQVTLLGTDDDDRCWFADTTTNGVAGSGTAVSKCCSVGVN